MGTHRWHAGGIGRVADGKQWRGRVTIRRGQAVGTRANGQARRWHARHACFEIANALVGTASIGEHVVGAERVAEDAHVGGRGKVGGVGGVAVARERRCARRVVVRAAVPVNAINPHGVVDEVSKRDRVVEHCRTNSERKVGKKSRKLPQAARERMRACQSRKCTIDALRGKGAKKTSLPRWPKDGRCNAPAHAANDTSNNRLQEQQEPLMLGFL